MDTMNEATQPTIHDLQRAKAQKVGLPVTRRHIFLCADQTEPNLTSGTSH